MPLSREEFAQQLTASGLLDATAVAESLSSLPLDKQPADGEALARELVKQKKLTKFQAEQIYAGKGMSLTLGNYVILDKLGQGGMGMVLKAEHRRMKRLVALKVMSPAAIKTPDSLKRFHREVEAAAKLRHPNIVAADDADEAKGTHFLVMEYVEGSDLSALVKKSGPLPVEMAVQCIIQAARGLEFAHEAGVIHRDIKPANLLMERPRGEPEGVSPRTSSQVRGLTPAGSPIRFPTVKILDMGLARIDGAVGGSSEGAGLTSTGTIMGTVDYMSPEQAMDTKHADARSDIYSLGCSLYYLLTGKVVYDGDTIMKKLMAHQHGAIPSLLEEQRRLGLRPDPNGAAGRDGVPTYDSLDSVFRRMVAKKPEDRPQSMTEVIAELERCLSGGSPTVAFERSGSSATNVAAGGAAGSGNELQDFLRQISGGEPATATSGKASGTVVTPSSGEAETMISSAGDGGTDPRTEQTVTLNRSGEPMGVSPRTVRGLTPSGSPSGQRKRTAILVSVAAAVVVLLAVFIWSRISGTPDSGPNVASKGSGQSGSPTAATSSPDSAPPSAIRPQKVGGASSPTWRATAEQQAFFDAVAKLSADEQVEAVKKKLAEVNPGFEGKLWPTKEGARVVGLSILDVTDLWPVRALSHLKTLELGCSYTAPSKLSDLSPLAGLPLTSLRIYQTNVSDLSPLAGMRLTSFTSTISPFSDLKPLAGMPLTQFTCNTTQVSDLAPLAGMPLTHFNCISSPVSDLGPLVGMPLRAISCMDTQVSDLGPLVGMPLTELVCQSTKVVDLSPLKGMSLHLLNLTSTNVRDLTLLAGMPLQNLQFANTAVSDLTPLAGMPLQILLCQRTRVADLSPLKGMLLTNLALDRTSVADLSELAGMPLSYLRIDIPLFHEPDEKLVRSLAPRSMGGEVYAPTPAEKFWETYLARQQAAEAFANATAKLPPEEQRQAITKRFHELNKDAAVEFGPQIREGQIVEVTLTLTEQVADVTPLRALAHLKSLTIVGGPHWLDLSPLNSTPLESLTCRELIARRNAHILKSMTMLTKIDARPEPNTTATNLPNAAPPPAKTPFDAKQARAHQEAWAKHLGTTVETTNSVGAKMILIPPGEFLMGSSDEQVAVALQLAEQVSADQLTKDHIQKSERPQHRVVISQPFLIGATEVTVGQFKKFAASGFQTEAEKAELAAKSAKVPATNDPQAKPFLTYLKPGYAITDESPAAAITWNDAFAFCEWLSQQEQTTYRLPTESEWEYACRAGTPTQFSFGDDPAELPKYAWFRKNASARAHPVGEKLPNAFGLYDMHGNLWEWCDDRFNEKWYERAALTDPTGSPTGNSRLLRGGLWYHTEATCRSAHRNNLTPSFRSDNIAGFRVVRVPVAHAARVQ